MCFTTPEKNLYLTTDLGNGPITNNFASIVDAISWANDNAGALYAAKAGELAVKVGEPKPWTGCDWRETRATLVAGCFGYYIKPDAADSDA